MNLRRHHSPAPDAGALGTILSIWAHPDDETYLAAGLMADACDRGQRVVCAWATDGDTDDLPAYLCAITAA